MNQALVARVFSGLAEDLIPWFSAGGGSWFLAEGFPLKGIAASEDFQNDEHQWNLVLAGINESLSGVSFQNQGFIIPSLLEGPKIQLWTTAQPGYDQLTLAVFWGKWHQPSFTPSWIKQWFAYSGQGIFLKDAQGKYMFANAAMCSFLGADPDLYIGKTDQDFLFGEEVQLCQYSDQLALAEGEAILNEKWVKGKVLHIRKFRIQLPEGLGIGGVLTDITQEMQKDLLLQSMSHKLQRAEFANGFGLWEYDGFQFSMTAGAKSMLELEERPLTFEHFIDVFSKTDKERLSQAVALCFTKGKSFQELVSVALPPHGEAWFRVSGQIDLLQDQPKVSGIIRLVTKEKHTADAIYLQALMLRNIHQAVVASDGQDKIIYWNQAATHLYGLERQDMVGKSVRDFHQRVFGEPLLPLNQKISQTNEERWTLPGKLESRLVSIQRSPIRDEIGRATGCIEVSWDMTQTREDQLKLAASEKEARALANFYRSLAETESIYVVKTDVEGRYSFVNDYFAFRFGGGRSMLGLASLDSIHPDDHAACLETVQCCFEKPGLAFPVTLKKYLPNGQLVYGKWEFRGITDGAGQITEILCTGYDITPLMESIDRAETLLNLTAIQNARLRSFAYIVSHNIRSHATNLISLVDLMRQPQSQAEQPAFMDMLQTSVHRLDNTLRDLNQVISVTDATELDWKEVHIHEAVNVVMQTVQGQMTALKGELNWHFKEALTLWTSPPFFESILLNLVSNAIKYRKPLLPPKIDVWMEKTEEHFTLRIQDKGVGIDLEKYGDKLFGMYKTFHGNKDARGFGLYITRAQVEALGGSIQVQSRPGVETEFRVILPLTTF